LLLRPPRLEEWIDALLELVEVPAERRKTLAANVG
jgi:hypothetical protein